MERRVTDTARRSTGRVFCSLACRDGAGSKPRRGETHACPTCGADVYSTPAVPRHYCSKACHDEGQRQTRVDRVCASCSEPFVVKHSFSDQRYCGRECYLAARNSTSVGRLHNGRPVRRDAAGYLHVFEPDHPKAYRYGYVLEHRWVAEQTLGRQLEDGEVVHHLNGRKWDNRPENLEVMSHGQHSSLTGQERSSELAALRAELDEYRRRHGTLD